MEFLETFQWSAAADGRDDQLHVVKHAPERLRIRNGGPRLNMMYITIYWRRRPSDASLFTFLQPAALRQPLFTCHACTSTPGAVA